MMSLCRAVKVGYVQAQRLIDFFGSAEAVWHACDEEISGVEGIRPEAAAELAEKKRGPEPEREYERIKRLGISFVSRLNSLYPKRLLTIPDPPNGLFYIGRLQDESRLSVAVIGSRSCSAYGREMSLKFARELAAAGADVVSGMAAGVDGFAHRGALNGGGKTYAVLGCGVDICYPRSNTDIYTRIPEEGAVISEYYPGEPPLPLYFPRRNRIISGLSDAVLVVEARKRSGTLITVDQALEQGREIFALPGRACDSLSFGPNNLIRNGAGLVISTENLLEDMGHGNAFALGADSTQKQQKIKNLASVPKKVYACLSLQPTDADSISELTGLPVGEIGAALTMLELKGLAVREDCSHFTAVRE